MIASPEYIIAISLIADLETSLLEQIRFNINRIFGYKTEMLSLISDVAFALDSERNQYNSTVIIEKLATLAPVHAIKVIAIVQVDLFIPILTHVYGEAQLKGISCVISTHRLKDKLSSLGNPIETYNQRVTKEITHELGHTFGLHHCKDPSCIMHYCRTINDVDAKSDELCHYCNVLLEDEIIRLRRI